MHVAQLRTKQWEPESDYERWVSTVADEYPELTKCEMVAGNTTIRCVSLRIRDQDVLVHLERTVCDLCGDEADCCGVPDFGSGDAEYRDFMTSLPRLSCPVCSLPYERRMVVRQANRKSSGEQVAAPNP